MDLYEELNQLFTRLERDVTSLQKTGAAYAQAYHDYRVALANELLELKANGTPATNAASIARGKVDVAKHKYDELANEAIYLANKESINATKLKIRVVDAQLAREWGRA